MTAAPYACALTAWRKHQRELKGYLVHSLSDPSLADDMALIEQVARDKATPVSLSKVEDIRAIMSYGVMSTPGVVIDGKVVHAGGVPTRAKIESWLASA